MYNKTGNPLVDRELSSSQSLDMHGSANSIAAFNVRLCLDRCVLALAVCCVLGSWPRSIHRCRSQLLKRRASGPGRESKGLTTILSIFHVARTTLAADQGLFGGFPRTAMVVHEAWRAAAARKPARVLAGVIRVIKSFRVTRGLLASNPNSTG